MDDFIMTFSLSEAVREIRENFPSLDGELRLILKVAARPLSISEIILEYGRVYNHLFPILHVDGEWALIDAFMMTVPGIFHYVFQDLKFFRFMFDPE